MAGNLSLRRLLFRIDLGPHAHSGCRAQDCHVDIEAAIQHHGAHHNFRTGFRRGSLLCRPGRHHLQAAEIGSRALHNRQPITRPSACSRAADSDCYPQFGSQKRHSPGELCISLGRNNKRGLFSPESGSFVTIIRDACHWQPNLTSCTLVA